ncbi:hypothetical protein ACFL16_00475 [Patescibacteria group bacterium]
MSEKAKVWVPEWLDKETKIQLLSNDEIMRILSDLRDTPLALNGKGCLAYNVVNGTSGNFAYIKERMRPEGRVKEVGPVSPIYKIIYSISTLLFRSFKPSGRLRKLNLVDLGKMEMPYGLPQAGEEVVFEVMWGGFTYQNSDEDEVIGTEVFVRNLDGDTIGTVFGVKLR